MADPTTSRQIGFKPVNGYVIGTHGHFSTEKHAYVMDPLHGVIELGTLGGRYSNGSDINDHGQVTGFSTLNPNANDITHAFIGDVDSGITCGWRIVTSRATNRQMTDLASDSSLPYPV